MKFRALNPSDRTPLSEWIEADPAHQGQPVEFWLAPQPGVSEVFAVEDEEGTVFYVRAENILRLHIQFPPQRSKRLLKAISDFAEEIKTIAKEKYQQIIFQSESLALIGFLQRRGYKTSPGEYTNDIQTTVTKR